MKRARAHALLAAVSLLFPMAVQGQIVRPQGLAPSASVSVSPATGATNHWMTFTATLNNPPLYVTPPPPPQYGFAIRQGGTEVSRRDYATSSSFTWRPASAGDYTVVISIKTFRQDGSQDRIYDGGMGFRVQTYLTWTSQITAATLGATPHAKIANRTIKDIVNSAPPGARPDDPLLCRDCHSLNSSRPYKPNTTQLVTSATLIPRGDASNSWYKWSTAGPSGIVERFCAAGKPPQLCSLFRKWAADGYRQ